MLKILGATIHQLVGYAARHLEFVHVCVKDSVKLMGRPCSMLKLDSYKEVKPRTRVLHRIILVCEHDKA